MMKGLDPAATAVLKAKEGAIDAIFAELGVTSLGGFVHQGFIG
jgi:hypothetical protein